jgi:hypothetical protein
MADPSNVGQADAVSIQMALAEQTREGRERRGRALAGHTGLRPHEISAAGELVVQRGRAGCDHSERRRP